MYKLVVSGFDGTLLDDDLAISVSTVLTIDEVRRKNCKFVVATGRGINFVKDYIKDVNFIDYIVALNGSYVYDVLRDKIIFEKSVKKTTIRKIINEYKKQAVRIYLCTDHSKCLLNVNNEETDEVIVRDIGDFLKCNKVYKMEIHTGTQKESKMIVKKLKNEYSDLNFNLQKYDRKDYLIEITACNVSKYMATREIAKKEMVKNEEIIAYGDNYNDLDLLKNVGYSVAVENAIREVKDICRNVTFSNNNRGVEKSLFNILLTN